MMPSPTSRFLLPVAGLVAACALVTRTPLRAQEAPRDLQMRVDVAYLASDLLAGRASGSPFGEAAAVYIAERMRALGLRPAGDSGTYLQRFPIVVAGHGHGAGAPQLHTDNVLGYLDRGAAHTLVIGAHYDHLGFGGQGSGSLHVGEPAPHNGADDNASGVAVLLDLAERLQADDAPRAYNVLFAGFGAEEMGLIGSKYLAANLPADIAPVAAMLNFDMVGRLSGDSVLAVNGTGTSPTWAPLLERVSADRVTIRPHASGLGPSDHASFYLLDLPVLHFFTGQHPQYHKPDDDIVLVNFDGMVTVSDLVYDLVAGLPQAKDLAFTKTKDESQRAAASFKVTLGIMPDYVHAGTGMRIDGVLADRPAERAGLQRGDVLVEMAGKPVGDIYDYMEGLGDRAAGDRVEVVIVRDGERLRKMVTF